MRDVSLEEGRLARRCGNNVGVGSGPGPCMALGWGAGTVTGSRRKVISVWFGLAKSGTSGRRRALVGRCALVQPRKRRFQHRGSRRLIGCCPPQPTSRQLPWKILAVSQGAHPVKSTCGGSWDSPGRPLLSALRLEGSSLGQPPWPTFSATPLSGSLRGQFSSVPGAREWISRLCPNI